MGTDWSQSPGVGRHGKGPTGPHPATHPPTGRRNNMDQAVWPAQTHSRLPRPLLSKWHMATQGQAVGTVPCPTPSTKERLLD